MSLSFGQDLSRFPGGDLVAKGLSDVREGRTTVEALLVQIAQPRLASLGFDMEPPTPSTKSSEHLLYEALEESHGSGAHSAYNALIRKIVSFAQAYAASKRVQQN
jgi:hypothetical protein